MFVLTGGSKHSSYHYSLSPHVVDASKELEIALNPNWQTFSQSSGASLANKQGNKHALLHILIKVVSHYDKMMKGATLVGKRDCFMTFLVEHKMSRMVSTYKKWSLNSPAAEGRGHQNRRMTHANFRRNITRLRADLDVNQLLSKPLEAHCNNLFDNALDTRGWLEHPILYSQDIWVTSLGSSFATNQPTNSVSETQRVTFDCT